MSFSRLVPRLALVLLVICGTACVAGQKVALNYAPDASTAAAGAGSVALTVTDQRPFVVNGDKDPAYIGHFRAGFGNPWDVKTDGEVALAKLIDRDLSADLRSLGFELPTDGAARRLDVTIVDWNFDSYTNVKFWYRLQLRVSDGSGSVLLEEELAEDNVVIKGSVMTGPKKAFKKEYPGIYQGIIKKIVRENPKVREALRQ